MRSVKTRSYVAALAAITIFGLGQRVNASAITDWQDGLQRRAESLVKAITGANNVYVFAKLDLETVGTAEDKLDKLFRPTGTNSEILPGISKDDIGPRIGRGDTYTAGERQEHMVRIRSVELLITLPSSVSAERINLIKTRLPPMLGFTDRDKLVIEQISMAGTWERAMQRLSEVFPLLLIGFLLALGVAAAFAMGPLKTVLKELRKVRQTENGSSGPGLRASPSLPNAPNRMDAMAQPPNVITVSANGKSSNGSNKEDPPFSFITEENLPKVIHLLSTEPPELLAYITSSVSPATAVAMLNSLTPEKKKAVMKELAQLKVHEPETIRAMAQRLSERVSCISGGVDRLGELFWEMDEATQDSYLKMLEKTDPATAEEIRRRLITVDDVFTADPNIFRQVLWESYRLGDLPTLLKSRSADEQKKALAALPASLQRVVEEDLTAVTKEPVDSDKAATAEKNFLLIARKLIKTAKTSSKKGALA